MFNKVIGNYGLLRDVQELRTDAELVWRMLEMLKRGNPRAYRTEAIEEAVCIMTRDWHDFENADGANGVRIEFNRFDFVWIKAENAMTNLYHEKPTPTYFAQLFNAVKKYHGDWRVFKGKLTDILKKQRKGTRDAVCSLVPDFASDHSRMAVKIKKAKIRALRGSYLYELLCSLEWLYR